MRRIFLVGFFVVVAPAMRVADGADIVINEFMAVNDTTLQDEDLDYSDWIEIHNISSNTVDLSGWYLTDKSNDLQKWTFPGTNISSGGFIVIFASSKDRAVAGSELHTNFKLSGNGEYLGLVRPDGVTVEHAYSPEFPEQDADVSYGLGQDMTETTLIAPGANTTALIPTGAESGWTNAAFDDSGWLTGTTGVGYETDPGGDYDGVIGLDVVAMRGVNGSVYARVEFETTDPSSFDILTLDMLYDDGFAAYINGEAATQTNAPSPLQWNSQATVSHEAFTNDYKSFNVSGSVGALVAGTNVLAIHGLNVPVHSSDMLVLPQLLAVALGEPQTNSLIYFETPTPGAQNTIGIEGYVSDTAFSVDRGFFTNAFSVAITSVTAGADIYYSVDGSKPTRTHGLLYTNAIAITNTTVLRAAAYKTGYVATDVDTHTYIFVSDVVNQSTNPPGPGWPTFPINGQIIDYGMDPNVLGDPRYTNIVDDALLGIDTVSIVTELPNLFDPASGIYVNAPQDGMDWERPASIEFIDPPGTNSTQANAGLRIRGGMSRTPSNPKHSFRVFFRSEYGDAKLDFALFGSEGVEQYDKIDFRTGQNFSWNMPMNSAYSTWLYDIFNRDTHREMGQPYTRGRFYHLYINGQYWGLYQTDERPEANFGESYFGGNDADYDTIKSDNDTGHIYATDGYTNDYFQLWSAIDAGVSGNEDYFRVQGLDTNGLPHAGYTNLLDVANLIDYMILVFFAGNRDMPIGPPGNDGQPRNLFSIFNRNNPDGFKFIVHDCEHSLEVSEGVSLDRVSTTLQPQFDAPENCTPWWIHRELTANAEYLLNFADRAHACFFNDGILSPSACTNRWLSRAAEIDSAIIAESARWGDFTIATPYTRDDDWLPVVDWLVTNYFAAAPSTRSDIVLDQLKANGLYPQLAAPAFSMHGGGFTNGFSLSISATSTVYYTLDGSDPREIGFGDAVGAVYTNPIALPYTVNVKARALEGATWSALNEAVFVLQSPESPLRVTEIMYHPADPTGAETNASADATDFEFIEVQNTSTQAIGLAGIEFVDGIVFDFTDGGVAGLDPGEYAVVVRDYASFTNRYTNWANINTAGEYHGQFFLSGALANGGESLHLQDDLGRTIQSFDYDDGWYPNTDGEGFSLTLIDSQADTNVWSNMQSWRPSAYKGGTPGEGPVAFWTPGDIVVNEILTHQDQDNPGDWIELYNASTNAIDVDGWYVSDDESDFTKVSISGIGAISAGGYAVLTEYDDFGTNVLAAGTNGFALSEFGETLYLSSGTNGVMTGYRETEAFGAAENGITFGRYVKSNGAVDFTAMSNTTSGAANSYPQVGPLTVSEIMYHPQNSNAFEFIEIQSITNSSVSLFDPAYPSNTWKLDGGIEFLFPTNTIIDATNYILVVPTNEAGFRAVYTNTPVSVDIYGPYSGKLANGGESVQLFKPGAPEGGTGVVPWIQVDLVEYDDQQPWPVEADGLGPSIERVAATEYGNDATNWAACFSEATPGTGPEDADFDGMPDWWEILHFGSVSNANGAAGADWDGDAFPNLHEYLGSYDPTSSVSYLGIVDIAVDAQNNAVVQWMGSVGERYSIMKSTDLVTDAGEAIVTNISGVSPINTHTVATDTAKTTFYRISLEE